METLKVAALIEALALVGQVYRNKDGSQPAEAVKKIIAQLDGAGQMTLAEWAAAKRTDRKAAPNKRVKAKPEPADLQTALASLQSARTQSELRDVIGGLTLGARDWRTLAQELTGRAARSGTAARKAVEMHLSDRLLLDERIASVKRQFGPATPLPAGGA